MNEIIGIAATIFILIGFLFSGEKKIRVLNIVGAMLYIVYGILIGSESNIILNAALIIIHIMKLCRMRSV